MLSFNIVEWLPVFGRADCDILYMMSMIVCICSAYDGVWLSEQMGGDATLFKLGSCKPLRLRPTASSTLDDAHHKAHALAARRVDARCSFMFKSIGGWLLLSSQSHIIVLGAVAACLRIRRVGCAPWQTNWSGRTFWTQFDRTWASHLRISNSQWPSIATFWKFDWQEPM